MNWSAVTFDWNRVRAFLVTAEEGSLSAAARALGSTQPTLGRQVDALEQELGIALFERSGRGLSVTPAGHALLDHARAMGDGAAGLALARAGLTDAVDGELSISASDLYAARLLPPVLDGLSRDHPELRIELVVDNALSDLRRREADIAIRNVRPEGGDLIARKIRQASARLYAAPALLDRLGRPTEASGFVGADCVEIDATGALSRLMAEQGFPVDRMRFPWRSGNLVVAWELVRRGSAIGVIDDRIGDADPAVERILPDLEVASFPVWLVAHRDVQRARRLRIVWDRLAAALA